ncbi:DEKNAAC101199 [Brettanomyces naardenensis]|uniref:DEKNAAC101199 n=1 Tax=Brettanomyces naardenensis TaxID=13370 RepID=A0A448YH57_BRENA|nr:DEKNAAC101199 [Brettanomyces naardenensis]
MGNENDLSDFEDEVLTQLEAIRQLKKERDRQRTNLVNSDDEEDPRQIASNGQQPAYFSNQSRPSRNERMLQQRLKETRETEELRAQKDSSGNKESFVSILKSHKERLKRELQKQHDLEEDLVANRVYSFDLGDKFKPTDITVNEKDFYTGKYLSKRYVPRKNLDTCVKDMKLMRVENVYADIVPPHYKPPSCANFVVFGIVAGKSEALTTSNGRKSKYMKVHLSNFRQQITLSLFDKAFEKYWKLRLGDIIGVLNPQIWPFKSKDSSGFTLFLKDDTSSIVEIGRARDFAYCKSIKRDGTRCKVPVDLSKGEYCDYHMEMQFKRTAAQRVELGGNVRMFAPTATNGQAEAVFMGSGKSKQHKGVTEIVVDSLTPNNRDQENFGFSSPEASKAFFDAGFTNPKFFAGIEAEKAERKRLKNEKDLRRRLAVVAGGENLRSQKIESSEERKKRNGATRIAFPPNTMNKIGFDPTRRIFEAGRDFDKKVSNSMTHQLLNSLKRESAKSTKILKPSKTFLREKKREWDATLDEFRRPRKKSKVNGNVIELSGSEDEDVMEEMGVDAEAGKRFLQRRRVKH